ncbi:MAG: hypothetical protein ABEI80_09725 [Haloplanus sp.]
MTDGSSRTPTELLGDSLTNAWRTMRSVYYANSPSWRFLKSGALVFFGFFLWSASNLLLSYQPGWTWLYYPMSYGFLLIVYGPVHHFVVIPLALRLRRRGGTESSVGRRLPTAGLVVFLIAVVVLGTAPTAPVVFDFQSSLEGAGADINPDLLCTKSTTDGETHVHCHLTESKGIDHVVVMSGGERVAIDRTPPFEFEVRSSQLTSVTGEPQFQVVLRDADGTTIRRYTRTLSMIPEG